ncbi:MAG TPA: T9SS type A sorting domain-containing protein [Candidatus Kapabacteria bacterium]|nr:T9SS type A sorting domain-containing protein [Candidatus Kapabacteria bacterium]HPO63637.1 T9SS type A sorting domain-containing protein [Candidatus Kapabacteria bacterium]
MLQKIFLITLAFMLFASNTKATPPAEPDLAIEWQKNVYPNEISFAKFSADGNYIYCAVGNTIKKMDASNGEFVSTFEDKDKFFIYEMQISKNGNIIATRTGGGGIVLWDTQLEKSIKFIPFGTGEGSSGAFCFDITPDGNYLVVGNLTEIEEPQQQYFNLLLYDIQKSEIKKSIPIEGSTQKIKISNDGNTFALGITAKDDDEDKWYQKLSIWDYTSFQEIAVLENNELSSDWGYRNINFSSDSNFLSVVRENYYAAIYDLNTKKQVKLFYKNDGKEKYCMNFHFLPNINYFLVFFVVFEDVNVYELELHSFESKIKTYNYQDQTIESYGNENNWRVFYGGGAGTYYMFKNDVSSVSPTLINKENISIKTNNNLISIELNDINTEQLSIIISDLLGKTVFSENIQVDQSNNKIPIYINLNTGTYLCKVIADNKEYTQKIEIVR